VASPAPPSGAPIASGPVVAVPLSTGVIAAHRVADGAPHWTRELRAEQSLAADGERIYVASGEAIHALVAGTGDVAWTASIGGKPTAPPLAHAGWVIAAAAGELIALRASDGSVLWRKVVGPIEFRPSLDGELLVASIADGRIVALDVRDGSSRWATDLRASPGEPFAIGGRVYVGTKDRYFYSLLSSTGRIEDHRKIAAEILGRVAVNDRFVYFSALDNTVRAFLRRGGSEAWHQGLSYRPGTGPVLLGEVVVVPGYVEAPLPAFAAANGTAAGTLSFGGLLVALPVFTTLADGRDVVFAATGGLENKWTVSLQAPPLVAPVVVRPLTALPGVAVPIPPLPGW
jgi:outer membrane protein assembly factor BamB